MNDEQLSSLLERYIRGNASPDERAHIDALMAQDPDLAAEVAFERDLYHAVSNQATKEWVRDQLVSLRKQHKPKPILSLYRLVAIAASFALLVGAAWWMWFRPEVQSGQPDLFAFHFEPPASLDIPSATRGDEKSSEHIAMWERIDKAYRAKDYEQALQTLEQLRASGDQDVNRLDYNRGVLLLCMDRPQEAIAALEHVDSPYLENKTWYTALAWLQLDNKDMAARYLNEMVTNGYPGQEWASEILAHIQSDIPSHKTSPTTPSPNQTETEHIADPAPAKSNTVRRDYQSSKQYRYQGTAMAFNVTDEWNLRGDAKTVDPIYISATPLFVNEWPTAGNLEMQAAEKDFKAAMQSVQRKQYMQAATSFQKAIASLQDNQSETAEVLSILSNNVACAHMLANNTQGAEKALAQALSHMEKRQDDALAAVIYQNKAILDEKTDHSMAARASMNQALSFVKKAPSDASLLQAVIFANQGWLHHKLENKSQAKEAYTVAHKLFTGSAISGHPAHIALLQNMIILSEMTGDKAGLALYRKELAALKD